MKTILFFIVLFLACSSQDSTLKANLFGSSVVFKDSVFRVKLGVSGGFPPLFYDFQVLPEKWIHIGEFVFVPESDVKIPKKFILRVKVHDSLKNTLSFAVILTADGQSIHVEPVAYGYSHVFPPQILTLKILESPIIKAPNNFNSTQELLFHLQQAKIREKNVVDSSLTILPTTNEIDVLIASANLQSLSQTVKNVNILELNCNAKTSYLLEIVGRIKSATELEKLALTKLQISNIALRSEINKIRKELRQLQEEKERIQLSNLLPIFQLKKTELKKKQHLDDVAKAEIEALQFSIAKYEFSINLLNARSAKLKAKVDGYRIIIANPASNSAQLALISRQLLQISRQQEEIEGRKTTTSLSLAVSKQRTSNLNSLIEKIQLQKAILKKDILDLSEIITANDEKNQALDLTISLVKFKIANEEKKLKLDEILALQQKILKLNNLEEGIDQEINRIYYSCFGVNSFDLNLTQLSTYTLSYIDFQNYVAQAFGIQQLTISRQDFIKINLINVLSQEWIQTYGAPFSEKILAISNGFRFKDDFSCLEPSLLQTTSGTIIKIQKNIIHIQTFTTKVYLVIGACTRFESLEKLPGPPHQIWWKGVSTIEGVYDAYLVLTL